MNKQKVIGLCFKGIALFVVFTAAVILPSGRTFAGPGFESGVNDASGSGSSVPIDGGLSALVAAGIGYGVKKMRKRQNKHSPAEIEAIKKYIYK